MWRTWRMCVPWCDVPGGCVSPGVTYLEDVCALVCDVPSGCACPGVWRTCRMCVPWCVTYLEDVRALVRLEDLCRVVRHRATSRRSVWNRPQSQRRSIIATIITKASTFNLRICWMLVNLLQELHVYFRHWNPAISIWHYQYICNYTGKVMTFNDVTTETRHCASNVEAIRVT